MMLLALLVLGIRLASPPVQYDLIELNHFEPPTGGGYTQVIYYTWSEDYRRFEPEYWHLCERLEDYPTKVIGGWRVTTTKDKRRVDAFATKYRETWTDYDPERKAGKLKDQKYRRGYR